MRETKLIHPTAVISPLATIGAGSEIGAHVFIDDNVLIGHQVVIHPNVVIYSGAKIGDGVEIFPGAFVGKEPKGAGALARQPEFNKTIEIGNNCSIGPNVVIYYDVQIGENTLLGDGASIREKCRIGSKCIISRYVTINYNTFIGDRTKIMDNSHITGNAVIGSDVFISLQVGMANDNVVRKGYVEEEIRGPQIGNDVVVGMGSLLSPGIEIEDGATIGVGSIVTKNIPAHALAIGVPARVIRGSQE